MIVGHAVLIVERHVFERGNLAAEIASGGIGEPAPDLARGVAQALRGFFRTAVQKDAGGFARARAEDDHPRGGVLLFAGLLVDEVDAIRPPLRVERDFADHGIGDDVEIAGLDCRREEHRGRLKVRAHGATASAGSGVKALRTAIQRPGEDREAGRDHRPAELFAGALQEQFIGAGLGRRQEEIAVRIVLEPILGAEDADQLLGLVGQ